MGIQCMCFGDSVSVTIWGHFATMRYHFWLHDQMTQYYTDEGHFPRVSSFSHWIAAKLMFFWCWKEIGWKKESLTVWPTYHIVYFWRNYSLHITDQEMLHDVKPTIHIYMKIVFSKRFQQKKKKKESSMSSKFTISS